MLGAGCWVVRQSVRQSAKKSGTESCKKSGTESSKGFGTKSGTQSGTESRFQKAEDLAHRLAVCVVALPIFLPSSLAIFQLSFLLSCNLLDIDD